MKNKVTRWEPLPSTVPTLIHDVYGDSILVYCPKGDMQTPQNIEVGIRSAQLGMTVEKYQEMLKSRK